jgi:peptidoglycan/LPS O-acetylase OafA/YrhL
MVEGNNRFGYVDTLRGIAIFLVLSVHTSQFYQLGSELTFARYGQLGVQLFFVASAYTLCISMSNVDLSTENLKKFYIRRYFRIAPMYYIGIVMYFGINCVLYLLKKTNFLELYDFKGISSNLLLIHAFLPKYNNSIVPGGWSIATEVLFYFLFPFLYSFVKNYSFRKIIYLIILYTLIHVLVLIFAGKFLQFEKIENNSFYYYSIINQFPVFLCGIAMFNAIKNSSVKKRFFGSIFFISFILLIFMWQYNELFSFVLIPVFSGIAFMSLGCSLSIIDYRFKLFELIGKLSYSIYIFHFVFSWYIIVLIDKKISFLGINIYLLYSVYLLITLVFSVLIGLFTEKYIERYFVGVGKKIISNSIKK